MKLPSFLLVILVTVVPLKQASAVQIYDGMPYAEALFDLAQCAILISHELSSATPFVRTDVFRLADGRLLAVTSKAEKLGEPFGIDVLRVTSAPDKPLTKRLPMVSGVDLPKKKTN